MTDESILYKIDGKIPNYDIKEPFRLYRGGHKIRIICIAGRKALIEHMEMGRVGSKKTGYKLVLPHEQDITLIRHCWRIKE